MLFVEHSPKRTGRFMPAMESPSYYVEHFALHRVKTSSGKINPDQRLIVNRLFYIFCAVLLLSSAFSLNCLWRVSRIFQ